MSDKVFLDTNVIAYSFDDSEPLKQQRARQLMVGDGWAVSWQVVQEFGNLALHRFAVRMKAADFMDYLDLVLWPRCEIFPSSGIYHSAAKLHEQTQYRFYDCLIVASALAAGAGILYSEDLQGGRKIGPLTIRNPFTASCAVG